MADGKNDRSRSDEERQYAAAIVGVAEADLRYETREASTEMKEHKD